MPEQDKRQSIMRAAEQLSATGRFHEITTDEIAKAAGVGKGTIYRYFKDKDELFFETAISGFDQLCELVRAVDQTEDPVAAQLVAACEQIVGFFERRRRLFGMMQTEENRLALDRGQMCQRWREKRQSLVAALARIVHEGARRGEIRDDLPPEVLAALLLGMLRTRARDLPEVPESIRSCEGIVDFFLHGANSQDRGRLGPVASGKAVEGVSPTR